MLVLCGEREGVFVPPVAVARVQGPSTANEKAVVGIAAFGSRREEEHVEREQR